MASSSGCDFDELGQLLAHRALIVAIERTTDRPSVLQESQPSGGIQLRFDGHTECLNDFGPVAAESGILAWETIQDALNVVDSGAFGPSRRFAHQSP